MWPAEFTACRHWRWHDYVKSEVIRVGLFERFRRRPGAPRAANTQDTQYLRQWATQRRGVEGYLEPRTNVTETTLMLIAADGEWTRRRVEGPEGAHRVTRELRIPCYEVTKVGYPQRVRDYQKRQRVNRRRQQREVFGD